MAEYTIKIIDLIELGFNFGLDSYPIFDETYRQNLNDKILDYYKYREIGFETPALFRDRLNSRLNMIMPYYNQLYQSAAMEFHPFYTHDFYDDVDTTGQSEGTSFVKNRSENRTKNVHSDTPAGLLSIDDIKAEIYASTADIGESDYVGDSDGDTTSQFANKHQRHARGNTSGKSESELLKEYRSTFLNIDMLIIYELSDLFFSLWEV